MPVGAYTEPELVTEEPGFATTSWGLLLRAWSLLLRAGTCTEQEVVTEEEPGLDTSRVEFGRLDTIISSWS